MCRDYTKIPCPVEPSPPDERDYKLNQFVCMAPGEEIPEEYIVPYVPSVRDQGNTGMCMAFSLASIKEYQEWKERGLRVRYSPGFIYAQKTFTAQEGMIPRFDLGVLRRNGVCEFGQFPSIGKYEVVKDKFDLLDEQVKKDAKKQKIKSYIRLNNEYEIKKAVMELGPVLLAIDIYPSFHRTYSNGIVRDIKNSEKRSGGHAMVIVGWSIINERTYWHVLNSWGDDWANDGFCFIPVDYKGIMEVWGITDQTLYNLEIIMQLENKNMYANGEKIEMDVAPFALDDRTYVPVRHPFEALGCNVTWHPETNMIIIRGGEQNAND